MNTNLFGKTILIGREQEHGRLNLCVTAGEKPILCVIGAPNSVPGSVSRCQPKEGKAHCSIDIDNEGRLRITNLKPQNVTCVDGNEVLKKFITEESIVTIGRDQYPLEIKAILDAAANMVARVEKPAPKTFSIAHLKKVQEDYNDKNDAIEKEQRMAMLFFRGPMAFSALGGIVTFFAKKNENDILGNILMVITLLGSIITLYGTYKYFFDPPAKNKKEILNEYKKNYVCPNPDCGRKLTNFDYEELLKMKKCPFCGSKFEE